MHSSYCCLCSLTPSLHPSSLTPSLLLPTPSQVSPHPLTPTSGQSSNDSGSGMGGGTLLICRGEYKRSRGLHSKPSIDPHTDLLERAVLSAHVHSSG
ncbi:hypothetical protein J4Q44_G00003970 [Coregonus suidteri]|uniref:Uncharacterized protein n=1 Tax=Coregonus suidteri TaxID=861788 RepID=A0AAN8MCW2_9TELE